MKLMDDLEQVINQGSRQIDKHTYYKLDPDIRGLAKYLILAVRELESENRKLKGQILRMKRK